LLRILHPDTHLCPHSRAGNADDSAGDVPDKLAVYVACSSQPRVTSHALESLQEDWFSSASSL